MLTNHFPDILDEILIHNNQRSASANEEFPAKFRCSHTNIGKTQRTPPLAFHNQEIEVELSITAAFAIVYQEYFTFIKKL